MPEAYRSQLQEIIARVAYDAHDAVTWSAPSRVSQHRLVDDPPQVTQ